ncbi:glycosyltransferase family 25 protein [Nitratireductor sp. ZSWI3]|uniref:glycosyltransferase family 25 protein n=1 Tax=Nitratireductor sp. ZSWI3 TaxID=2966359 RepID=UPI00214FA9A0|nr:glycosyltransferase family 25 protein [Nitratireductor sp. ZSWI3]MCR4268468.1 glycosyltransferase family 25 protein [Nitratireductor sp. ZSWI3]
MGHTIDGPSERADLCAYILTVETEESLRRQHAEREMSALGIEREFVQGFRKTDPSLGEHYSEVMNLLLHKRSLTAGEIAVYAGHRRIWRRIVESGRTCALVLEDDFRVLDRDLFLRSIDDLMAHPGDWDLVKFFDYKPKSVVASVRIGSTTAVAHKYPASGAVAYLIGADAARALLQRKRIFRAVDEDFSHPWEFSIRVWSTQPNTVAEASDALGGSILAEDRQAVRRNRKILRSLWGNVLQGTKLARSLLYRHGLRAGRRSLTHRPL